MRMFFPTLLFPFILGACFGPEKPNDTGHNPVDRDGDGIDEVTDCDDADPEVYPGAKEVCNGVDDDCDGFIDDHDPSLTDGYLFYQDADGDSYGDMMVTTYSCDNAEPGFVLNDEDCDDTDPAISPAAEELCDGIDNDCNSIVDDADPSEYTEWYKDFDGDGYGNSYELVTSCTQPHGYVIDNTDCDDNDPTIHPDADEYCDDEDNDCDGVVDEPDAVDARMWYLDADNDGYGNSAYTTMSCDPPVGYSIGDSDCDDANSQINPDAPEVCDGVDNDCDALVDDDDPVVDSSTYETYYLDADGDGFGDAWASTTQCDPPSGYVVNSTDCDDSNASINPLAAEDCGDGIDNDCDPSNDDEGDTYYADADADGYGDPSDYQEAQCAAPTGYVTDSSDCDDSDAAISPAATEVCDGVDNNCDSSTDGSDAVDALVWYEDADGDGFGNVLVSQSACTEPTGYVSDNTDCDDSEALSNPDEVEVCDSIDNNCDGIADGSSEVTNGSDSYLDADGDGYGNASHSSYGCEAPSGYVYDSTDCDDSDALTNPMASEYCDSVDNNCDSQIDEDTSVDAPTWYADADGDSYGDPASTDISCYGESGYVADSTDCNDSDALVSPAASEYCDEIDNDCDSQVDEADAVDALTWYEDADGDSYGNAAVSGVACDAPSGYVADNTDCDDTTSSANPGASEYCDGIDNDCDTVVDESDAVNAIDWYQDADSDSYGDDSTAYHACSPPSGYIVDGGDCDDADSAVNPGASEVCDSMDNDCDGLYDDDDDSLADGYVYYADSDGDGWGDSGSQILSCTTLTGYVDVDGDCDDTNALVSPDGYEVNYLYSYCTDGFDNDCDGDADSLDWDCGDYDGDGRENGFDPILRYDEDGDGIEESILVIASEVMTSPYDTFDSYYSGNGFDTWSGFSVLTGSYYDLDGDSFGDNISSLQTIDIDGEDKEVYQVNFAEWGEGEYQYRHVSFMSALDSASAVDVSNCSTWEAMSISSSCVYNADEFCASYSTSDGCGSVGYILSVRYIASIGVSGT